MAKLLSLILFLPVAILTVTSIFQIAYAIFKFKKMPKAGFIITAMSAFLLVYWYLLVPMIFKDALQSFGWSFIIYPIPHAIALFIIAKGFKEFKSMMKAFYYSVILQKYAIILLPVIGLIYVSING